MRAVSVFGILLAPIVAAQTTNGSPPPGQPAPPPPSTMQMTIPAESLAASDGNIYVNQYCAIFPDLTLPLTAKSKATPYFDSAVCHVESVEASQHREKKVVGDELDRSNVEVDERDYVLQNITGKPAVFVFFEEIPKGWRVDSAPQPVAMEDSIAVFKVHAPPDETVHLHVSVRHTKELKPKPAPAP